MTDQDDLSRLDQLWEALLSEDAPQIRKAWLSLTDDEASAVLEHLKRMLAEEGWAEAQRQSAATALDIIRGIGE